MNKEKFKKLWNDMVPLFNGGTIPKLIGKDNKQILTFEPFSELMEKVANRVMFYNEYAPKLRANDIEIGANFDDFEKEYGSIITSLKDINWEEVSLDVYNYLKQKGEQVIEKVQDGVKRFFAKREASAELQKADLVFQCIEKYLEKYRYNPLVSPVSPFDLEYRYMDWDFIKNGKETKLQLFTDKKFKILYRKDSKELQGFGGEWGCGDDGESFFLKFDMGQTAKFPETAQISFGKESESTGTLKSFSEACKSVKKCPSVSEVESGKKSYSLCMKCAEIEEIQKLPHFNVLYFSTLKSEGKSEITDQYFGPMMEDAVKAFQRAYTLTSTGTIDKQTLDMMKKGSVKSPDTDVKTQTPKQTEPPKASPIKTINVTPDMEF